MSEALAVCTVGSEIMGYQNPKYSYVRHYPITNVSFHTHKDVDTIRTAYSSDVISLHYTRRIKTKSGVVQRRALGIDNVVSRG